MKKVYQRERKRKHRYLVGFVGDGNCVYDMREHDIKGRNWVKPLTLNQAKRALTKLVRASGRHAIYEIVPIAIFDRQKYECE
jgi:hypothetical protein